MGLRKKLKSLLRRKRLFHRTPKPFSPTTSTVPTATPFYQHTNQAVLDFHSGKISAPTETCEPLKFQHKSYTTPSGVVIPPDFSYDRPKAIYQVSGIIQNKWHRDPESDDDESDIVYTKEYSDFVLYSDDEATTASDYSIHTLGRMTELALAEHHAVASLREGEPRPLPETPDRGINGGRAGAWTPGMGVRILTEGNLRRVRGLRMLNPEGM